MPADEPQGLICPECGADYIPGITECSDCHVALVEQTLGPEDVLPDDGDVEAATTAEAIVARGWRDVMTAAGVLHRIEVAADPEASTTYTLIVDEEDADWATALAEVVEEQPSIDPAVAMQQVRQEFTAAPAHAPEPDDDLFDVPDILPPVEIRNRIETAQTRATVLLVVSVLLAAAALSISPWWGLPAAIAVAEAVRARRAARALLAAWERENAEEAPDQPQAAKTSG